MKNRQNLPRRSFCALAGGAAVSLALSAACSRRDWSNESSAGRLTARPHGSQNSYVGGRTTLGDGAGDAILQIPKSEPKSNFPLLVFLHGAGQSADRMFDYLGMAPEEAGVAVLAPNSSDRTWDAIVSGGFGPDVQFMNRALEQVFERLPIDANRIIIGGFSDGASYAISLGLLNGDLFKGVMAFSPGFFIEGPWVGKPRFFISHGKQDPILPIEKCGRRIASELNAHAYSVTLREFEGGHEVPADVVREGFRWLGSL